MVSAWACGSGTGCAARQRQIRENNKAQERAIIRQVVDMEEPWLEE